MLIGKFDVVDLLKIWEFRKCEKNESRGRQVLSFCLRYL